MADSSKQLKGWDEMVETSEDAYRLNADSSVHSEAEYWIPQPGMRWISNNDGEPSYLVTIAEWDAHEARKAKAGEA